MVPLPHCRTHPLMRVNARPSPVLGTPPTHHLLHPSPPSVARSRNADSTALPASPTLSPGRGRMGVILGEGGPQSPGQGRARTAPEETPRLSAFTAPAVRGGAPAAVGVVPGPAVRPGTADRDRGISGTLSSLAGLSRPLMTPRGGGRSDVYQSIVDVVEGYSVASVLPLQRPPADGALIHNLNHQQQPHVNALPQVEIEP